MFDVGFTEMMVIAVVALIVIGPERLPKVARTFGHLVGRLQRYVRDVKADINREMELDELRKFKEEFQSGAQAVEQTIHGELQNAEAGIRSVADDASPVSASAPADWNSAEPELLGESTGVAGGNATQPIQRDPSRP
jgi:sec-independent protein translocase protein TatB